MGQIRTDITCPEMYDASSSSFDNTFPSPFEMFSTSTRFPASDSIVATRSTFYPLPAQTMAAGINPEFFRQNCSSTLAPVLLSNDKVTDNGLERELNYAYEHGGVGPTTLSESVSHRADGRGDLYPGRDYCETAGETSFLRSHEVPPMRVTISCGQTANSRRSKRSYQSVASNARSFARATASSTPLLTSNHYEARSQAVGSQLVGRHGVPACWRCKKYKKMVCQRCHRILFKYSEETLTRFSVMTDSSVHRVKCQASESGPTK